MARDDDGKHPKNLRRWKRLLRNAREDVVVEIGSHDLRHFAAAALLSG